MSMLSAQMKFSFHLHKKKKKKPEKTPRLKFYLVALLLGGSIKTLASLVSSFRLSLITLDWTALPPARIRATKLQRRSTGNRPLGIRPQSPPSRVNSYEWRWKETNKNRLSHAVTHREDKAFVLILLTDLINIKPKDRKKHQKNK